MTYERKFHKRCAVCTDNEHSHDFTVRVIKQKDGWYLGTGPFPDEEMATAQVDLIVDEIERQNSQHTA